jgi:hypothetical protein
MSKEKRRSIFGRNSLTTLTTLSSTKDESQPSNLLRKRRTASFMSTMSTMSDMTQSGDSQLTEHTTSDTPNPARPPLSRGTGKRSSMVFGSLRGFKLPDDDEPLSAVSTRTSTGFGDHLGDEVRDHKVLHYGEVQTSSSMFRKKREFLVLTETHLLRFKSQSKAAESFPS